MKSKRVTKHGEQITQSWMTTEAKQAALIAAHRAKQNVYQWISAAIIQQAAEELHRQDAAVVAKLNWVEVE